ncbi:hypothetical protein CJF31_00004346 [Rutstroemia sp. NJR-2017a BVV2]|nr:hypothetical protein CJF31_00004346 [Rutstroemia sp. NJR-2017a BVV2]
MDHKTSSIRLQEPKVKD